MKKLMRLSVVFGVALIVSFTINAQSIDGVISSLKEGNASKVSTNAGDNLQLTIADKSNTYSKAQAGQILKDFFEKVNVKGFDLKHKGNSSNGSYAIGTLKTGSGNYRVNIFMRKNGSSEVIKELRFQLIE